MCLSLASLCPACWSPWSQASARSHRAVTQAQRTCGRALRTHRVSSPDTGLSQREEELITRLSSVHSLTYSLAYLLTHSLTHLPAHSPAYSLTHPPVHSLTYLLTYPPAHSPARSLTHSPAHSVVFVTHFSWTSLSGLPCIMNPQKLCAFQSWQILYKNRGHTY